MRNVMTEVRNLSVEQLRQALVLKERIESLQAELAGITWNGPVAPGKIPGKRTMSASGKARIAAGQRARWAKVRAEKVQDEKVEIGPKRRRQMTAAWRAKIAAAARARWRRAKAAGRNAL
jgi:hypothetical protein